MSKQCGTCTKCCDGTLYGDVNGHIMGNGKPCIFLDVVNKKCGAYEKRPTDPCKTYKCMWLKYEDVPLWLKPENSPVMVSALSYQKNEFLILNCFGKDYPIMYLNYVKNYCTKNNINLMYEIPGMNNMKFTGNIEAWNEIIFNSPILGHNFIQFTHGPIEQLI
jgi:hypothetical protein